jgi:hypothetical protein
MPPMREKHEISRKNRTQGSMESESTTKEDQLSRLASFSPRIENTNFLQFTSKL